jgi:hypothetical protein
VNARFFKKFSPSTDVLLSNGVSIKFVSLDTLVGYFSTNDSYVQSEQRYGMEEIGWDEFNRDYIQKKSNSPTLSSPVWREELSHKGLQSQTPLDKLRALGGVAVAANKTDIKPSFKEPVTVAECPKNAAEAKACGISMTPATPAPAKPAEPFAPPVGKRKYTKSTPTI